MLFECDRCLQLAVWCFCRQAVDCPAHYTQVAQTQPWRNNKKRVQPTSAVGLVGQSQPALHRPLLPGSDVAIRLGEIKLRTRVCVAGCTFDTF